MNLIRKNLACGNLFCVLILIAMRVEMDYAFDRPVTDGAKVIGTSEHDAVDLWPIVPSGFVHRAFECAHFPAILFMRKECLLMFQLFTKERLHLAFRPFVF